MIILPRMGLPLQDPVFIAIISIELKMAPHLLRCSASGSEQSGMAFPLEIGCVWESLDSPLKISARISAGCDTAKASASKNKSLLLINFQIGCFLEAGKVAEDI